VRPPARVAIGDAHRVTRRRAWRLRAFELLRWNRSFQRTLQLCCLTSWTSRIGQRRRASLRSR